MARINPLTGGLEFPDEHTETQRDVNAQFDPQPSSLSLEQRFELCNSVGEEVIKPQELMELLARKANPICYDGFEPSGRMHIAQGILKSINVNKLTDSGCIFLFWVADWFALLNNKMGGDLAKIQVVGRYMIEIWRAAGMNMRNVKFLWASEEINRRPNEYWLRVMDIARKKNIKRMIRCSQIMGREESDEMQAAQILYPCMQCSDIFFLKADICQLGMDQRKVNALAREYCDDIGVTEKPVIVSHHMLMGLQPGEEKMSKSKPDSAIFMEDSAEDVVNKIKKAYCVPGEVAKNPVLDYCKHLLFNPSGSLTITRPPEYGGSKTYVSFEELQADFESSALHPGDLKPAVAAAINALLEPVRRHFETDPYAHDLLMKVRSYAVTR
jgi:tyrosyl-tRNA synthetase